MPKRPAQYSPEERRRRVAATRRWEARQKAAGRCITCGKARKKSNKWHCARHAKRGAELRTKYRMRNPEIEKSRMRAYAVKRRKAARDARIAAGDPPRAWVRRNPRKPLDLYNWPKKRQRKAKAE